MDIPDRCYEVVKDEFIPVYNKYDHSLIGWLGDGKLYLSATGLLYLHHQRADRYKQTYRFYGIISQHNLRRSRKYMSVIRKKVHENDVDIVDR